MSAQPTTPNTAPDLVNIEIDGKPHIVAAFMDLYAGAIELIFEGSAAETGEGGIDVLGGCGEHR